MTFQEFQAYAKSRGIEINHELQPVKMADVSKLLGIGVSSPYKKKYKWDGPAGNPRRVFARSVFQALQGTPETKQAPPEVTGPVEKAPETTPPPVNRHPRKAAGYYLFDWRK